MGWKAEWDVGAIVDGGWGQDTRTIFKGVHKVTSLKKKWIFC
jgi:asparagine synthase (glutamine-hydrolysing)